MNKKSTKYWLISILLVTIIEVTTHVIFQRLEKAARAHQGELEYVWWLYIIALIVAAILFFASLNTKKREGASFPLALVALALAHCSFMVWSIECCPGG